MRVLSGKEEDEAKAWMSRTVEVASFSGCLHRRCGAIIVKDGVEIGSGVNSPPGGLKLERCFKDDMPEDFPSDKTCCVHAEPRALEDALRRNPEKIPGSTIYFARLWENGEIKFSGKPRCTYCSKSVLDAKIKEFVLWHKEGICAYGTEEYNMLSFQYRKELDMKN